MLKGLILFMLSLPAFGLEFQLFEEGYFERLIYCSDEVKEKEYDTTDPYWLEVEREYVDVCIESINDREPLKIITIDIKIKAVDQ